jgi:uncharacterized membrane protein
MQRLRHVLDWLRTRLWLIPGFMTAGALGLAYLLLAYEFSVIAGDGPRPWWLFSGDAGTARNLLSTLLSGMITMTSLVVSITIVVLSLAAGQLGPRLIWNFVGDRQIQAVIGLFIGTILYLLIVLRTLNDELGPGHVPHLAITIGSALTIACLFALLAHVNKLARSIVSDTIVREVADRLDRVIAALPADGREPDPGAERQPDFDASRPVTVDASGYVQLIDYAELCRAAVQHDLQLYVTIRPGEFAIAGNDYIRVAGNGALDDDTAGRIRGAIVLGSERTPSQDMAFSLAQLVEIALRALSPSLNDPFTAVSVINRLASALASLAGRRLRPPEHRDESGTVRVIAKTYDFPTLLDSAFLPIRHAAKGNPLVLTTLARRLSELLKVVGADRREPILSHLRAVERLAPTLGQPEDRRILEEVLQPALRGASPQAVE